jgi:riboflavin kinase/FMN adenylyltransferase
MELLSGPDSLPDPRIQSPVVTWGVFDGVHRGHRRVVTGLLDWARAEGVSSVVLTFDRHPAEVLTGRPMPLISPLGERIRLIGELGVDFLVVLNFTPEFSRLSADEFIRDLVARRLRARGIVLGHDSRFGRDRAGDPAMLAAIGRETGLQVRQAEPEIHEGRPVSSTLVREAVFAGRLDVAAYLLGRAPSLIGTVVRGDRRGSAIGVPTANLELHHSVRPPNGVYAADVALEGRVRRAVVNLGRRPTFKEGGPETIEVHLLDFPARDLYGRVLEVRFLARIRDEMKFDGIDALKARIAKDIEAARQVS